MTIDWNKLRLIMTPHVLRSGALFSALLKSVMRPLATVDESRVEYESIETQERQYGPAVKQLKLALSHIVGEEGVVLITDEEEKPIADVWSIADRRLTRIESGATPVWGEEDSVFNRGFVVRVPSRHSALQNEIKTTVERWKMVSSRYELVFYSD